MAMGRFGRYRAVTLPQANHPEKDAAGETRPEGFEMAGLPARMKAITVAQSESGPILTLEERPLPTVLPGQILIKIHTAGVNRADVSQAMGRYPPPPGASDIMGLEASGTVVGLGDGVTSWTLGQKVCALLPGGGYAEYAVTSELCALPIPKGLTLEEAGGLPEVYFTVWTNLMDSARLQQGDSVLIHGGSSGIGTAAIQLLTQRGHTVFATAGNAEKCAACLRLGAKRAVDYRNEDFVSAIKEETGGKGVDVILDMVGGDYVNRNLHTLAVGGRLANIAYMAGARVEVDFRIVSQRRLTLTASSLRPRSDTEKGRIRDALLSEVWPLFDQGLLRPIVDQVFPLSEAGAAQTKMRNSTHIGKILLRA